MWKWLIMVLAVAGVISAIALGRRSVTEQPVPPPLKEPVRNPFPSGIAGAGLVEAYNENVVIGVSEAGLVTRVFVKHGQTVKKGDPLIEIDSRTLQSQLVIAKSTLATAEAQLLRVQAFRRKEEEPPLRAALAQARAQEEDATRSVSGAEKLLVESEWALKNDEAKRDRTEVAVKANAVPAEELINVKFAVEIDKAKIATARENIRIAQAKVDVAKAGVDQAKAQLDIYLAGPWGPDIENAKAVVGEARAHVEQLTMDIERRTIRAPIDGTVLRLDVREGEFAPTASILAERAPLVLGNVKVRNVRVDIDEFDVRRYKTGAKAIAFLKGGSDQQIPLQFLRVDPFVIPKRALTNSQQELVDTRVLQVIYTINDEENAVYPGQQLDVYIEAPPETAPPAPSQPADTRK